jgi:hypothetical protein
MEWVFVGAWLCALQSVSNAFSAARNEDGWGWRLLGFFLSVVYGFVAYKLFTL